MCVERSSSSFLFKNICSYELYKTALKKSCDEDLIVLDLLKTLAILSDTTVWRYAVDREDLKLYWNREVYQT